MSDRRTGSDIHVVKPVNAVYSPEGEILATSNEEPQPPLDTQVPEPLPVFEDSNEVDTSKIKTHKMYLVDDWVLSGHRLNIVGVYDNTGFLQGGLFIADHDGTPHSLVKPEEEKGVLFHRLCEILGVPTELPKGD